MNKLIELALAREVIYMSQKSGKWKDNVIYSLNNGEPKEEAAYSGLEMIETIMKEGVSPIVVVEYQDKAKTLLEHVVENASDNKTINYFIDLMKSEHLSQLNIDTINRIYNFEQDSTTLEKFFKLGFDFKQGTFEELDKALSGDISFFELCMNYKSDFKFSFKYSDGMTLDQLLEEDIEYLKKNGNRDDISKQENLLCFLKKAREVEELKDGLETSLEIKSSSKNSYKI